MLIYLATERIENLSSEEQEIKLLILEQGGSKMSKIINSHLIGVSIKSLRVKRHLTQESLASDIGYSVRNLRRIENDGTSSIDVVNTFAEYFQVSAIDILNGCFLFIKKDVVDLRHTIITLICCSYTCTPV